MNKNLVLFEKEYQRNLSKTSLEYENMKSKLY